MDAHARRFAILPVIIIITVRLLDRQKAGAIPAEISLPGWFESRASPRRNGHGVINHWMKGGVVALPRSG
jgi:hypothetical protein